MKKRRKLIPILMTVMMIFSVFAGGPLSALAAETSPAVGAQAQIATVSQVFDGGLDALEDGDSPGVEVVQIGTEQELLTFASRVNAGEVDLYAELTADIEVTSDWVPISADGYRGIFDGKGHTLTLQNENSNAIYMSMFGTISEAGMVKNLKLNVNFVSSYYIAGVAMRNRGTIVNITVEGQLSTSGNTAGGIATISENTSSATITGPVIHTAVIAHCLNKATIISTATSTPCAGGIAGEFSGLMEYCGNIGNITFPDYNINNPASGGLAGRNNATGDAVIRDCYNVGTVRPGVGLANISLKRSGTAVGKIIDSFSYGTVYASGVTSNNTLGIIVSSADAAGEFDVAYIETKLSNANVYYLENSGARLFASPYFSASATEQDPFGEKSDIIKESFKKTTATEFTDGTVLAGLNRSRTDAPWVPGENYPVLKPFVDDGSYDPPSPAPTSYTVSTGDALLAAAAEINAAGRTYKGTITLTDDVNLTGKAWIPIRGFAGIFEGNGHTITGLTISAADAITISNIGMFETLAAGATVRNVVLSGVNINAMNGSYVGAVVGNNAGTIENVHVSGLIRAKQYVGGIAGIHYGTIRRCGVSAAVTSTMTSGSAYVGGIAGQMGGGSWIAVAEDIYSVGTVSTNAQVVGGLFGSFPTSNYTAEVRRAFTLSPLNSTATLYIGVVAGIFRSATLFNVYYKAIDGKAALGYGTADTIEAKTDEDFASEEFLALLNDGRQGNDAPWTFGGEGYPVLKTFANIENGGNQSGEDSETHMYIASKEDFLKFSDAVSYDGKYNLNATLTEDIVIDAGSTWNAVGRFGESKTSVCWYNGTFDGGGHKITFSYDGGANYTALFHTIDADGVVKNLNLDLDMTTGGLSGGVAVYNYGRIEYVTTTGTIDGASGGIVYSNENKIVSGSEVSQGTLSHCVNRADIRSGGGIAYNFSGVMEYCANEGNIGAGGGLYNTVNVSSSYGVFPYDAGTTYTISNCYNAGTLAYSGDTATNVWKGNSAAGLGGSILPLQGLTASTNACAENSFNYGDVIVGGADVANGVILFGGNAATADDIANLSDIYYRVGTGDRLFNGQIGADTANGADGWGNDAVKTRVFPAQASEFTDGSLVAKLNAGPGGTVDGVPQWAQGENWPVFIEHAPQPEPAEPIEPKPAEPEPADKATLAAKINEAKAIAAGPYTEESYAALQSAITAAETVLNDADATQETIDTAFAALTGALANLTAKPIEPKPADPTPIAPTPAEPTPNAQTLIDTATDITIEADAGVLPSGSKSIVIPVASGADYEKAKTALLDIGGNFTLFDISIVDGAGVTIQPNGTVKVSLPVAGGLNADLIDVYRINDDGTATRMESTVEDGKIVFYTDHFSLYALVERAAQQAAQQAVAEIPDTGDSGLKLPWLLISIAAIAILVAAVIARRKLETT
jgi:hypothetical protein